MCSYTGAMDTLIVFGGKYMIALPVVVLVGYFFLLPKEGRYRFASVGVTSALFAYGFARIAELFYSHVQPFAAQGFEPLISHTVDNAFPSDHATLAAALATTIFFYSRWLGLVL